MRRPSTGRLAAPLALVAFFALPGRAATVRVEALRLEGGAVVPAHASRAGSLSEREAARGRAELLRSPYTQRGETRSLFGGEVVAAFEPSVSLESREAALSALERVVRDVLDRDGWSRPFSVASPLTLLLVHPRADVPVLAGWDGREKGRLARPVLAVATAGRSSHEVAFDVARGVALLAVRQAGPEEAGWAVEGLAELLAKEALGLTSRPVAGASPFLAEQGSLAQPAASALFLAEAARLAPSGREALRVAWEEAGAQRGDDAEPFFRAVARRAREDGAEGLLASLVADAVADDPVTGGLSAGRSIVPGHLFLAAPPPLGWVRATFERLDETAGLEVVLPDSRAARGGRAVLVYRPLAEEPDTLPLLPGEGRVLPLAGAGALSLVLVDGSEGGELAVRLRRVPGYPAVLASSSAEWRDGAVQLGWRTSSHQELLAWVVSRLREEPDGSLVLDGREIVPTTDVSDDGSGFHFVDREALPGLRYRYRVAALTKDGLLSVAFEASVEGDLSP